MAYRSCWPHHIPSRLRTASGSALARVARSESSTRRRSWATSWATPSSSTASAHESRLRQLSARYGSACQHAPAFGLSVLNSEELAVLGREIVSCRRCPRLVTWREEVAREKRASFKDETYWGRPVPGFGDPEASIVVFGLAPAAHGANRTGRLFTGDRSGDFLFESLHRAGFANKPISRSRGDGLRLSGLWISAAVRCAPPRNRPTPDERDACLPYAARELEVLDAKVVVCLG